MKDFGDFSGETHDLIDASFTYFGATVRVNPELSDTDLLDIAEEASKVDQESAEAVVATKKAIRGYIHPDDFDLFWSKVKQHRQSMTDVGKVGQRIVEMISERPTGRPSDSSSGGTITAITSRDDASWRAQRREELAGNGPRALLIKQMRESQAV